MQDAGDRRESQEQGVTGSRERQQLGKGGEEEGAGQKPESVPDIFRREPARDQASAQRPRDRQNAE